VWAQPGSAQAAPAQAGAPEVRGTWLTTTANTALASPAHTAQTMRRLREIGLNTVYVESWKNGYTQFPSQVLARTIGVAQRPAQAAQDPSDPPGPAPARDLLQETVIEAHRNGLLHVAWFEYGFMAAHGRTMNHLRRLKPEWLSRDRSGNEVAPNGFVWMNPLHPQARAFLRDLMLEAIERYDLDGVQLDDRIVWPYVTMGYDDHTRAVYAAEHGGRQPPDDPREPGWMRWRADKLQALARGLVAELRAARPGLFVSLSPAPYPWSWEHYLLEWPKWAGWPAAEGWSEFVPQAYRMSYEAFERTWLEQADELRQAGTYRAASLVAGIRIVGDGPDSSWAQLRDSMLLVRRLGQAGHVLWFSRGVLERFPGELAGFYAASGPAHSPHFPADWRQPARPLEPAPGAPAQAAAGAAQGPLRAWRLPQAPAGRYHLIGHDGRSWAILQALTLPMAAPADGIVHAAERYGQLELIVDRRGQPRPAR
jgi:uncharacterized lipoprotein YddW (UPF0748 family)